MQRPVAQHKAAQPTGPTQPYTIYDSVTPGMIPANQPAAVYADGAYAASASQVSGHHSVLWIDTNGSDPNANVLDVEPGDATPAGAATWVQAHLSAQPHSVAIIYTMRSDWSAVQDAVGGLPSWEQSHVRYWIADPTGVPHVVPGSSATQWYWGSNYDISTANPNFAAVAEARPRGAGRRRVPPFPHGGTRRRPRLDRHHHGATCAMLSTRRPRGRTLQQAPCRPEAVTRKGSAPGQTSK